MTFAQLAGLALVLVAAVPLAVVGLVGWALYLDAWEGTP